MTDGDGIGAKGYEIDGLPVWYHPLRYDAWFGLSEVQRTNLRQRIRAEQVTAGLDVSDASVEELYRKLEYADRRKDGERARFHLSQIRRHHLENGGIIFDMATLGPHLEATWSDGISLKNVFPFRTGIYVHVGETLEYDRGNPASLIEGFYITHTDSPVRGWMLTFVTNYPEWDQREHHMPSHTLANFNRFIAFTIPEDADIATLNYKTLNIIGDKALAKKASLWHLARLATNAMLYLSRSRPDIQGTMSTFRVETSGTKRTEIYECGCDEVDWNIDWSNTTLFPGRWIVDDEGAAGRPMVTRWIPPKVVRPENRDAYLSEGGKVLEFKGKR
ncbi:MULTISPECIES: hypothetical protein [Agrobacterium]|uniref:hypothetical protein n=1 Tax=Agrobacterium TaxID=357 RepID=UPI00278A057E|nr:hypothetical protein [Agrobacterium sp. SORGH_AS_0745]MDP9762111.1 hypothetical protein [Agrobacterium tumefaciens]MDQ1220599.1 hypothetical protein [Agrobacterium sp. SORGH_AS_0745]